ncbi:MAG: HAMP domain-containing histidine kinase, partial [Oxalobacteraceae bacterium]
NIALNASLEHRVAVRTADLAVANEEIQRFAHIISHDLRAPLVNIVGFTNELGRDVKSVQEYLESSGASGNSHGQDILRVVEEEMLEAIDFINSSSRKMDGLISSILTMSREGKRTLQPSRIDLRDLIQSSTDAIQHQLSENGGEITLSLDVDHIVTDRLALEQVIGNLLDNAVKYRSISRPLRIVVTSTEIQEKVGITVSDNGRGINESDLSQIFELFKRVGIRDQQGEGVGLAYVQMMVRNLGGDISVTSSLGEGTTFALLLPHTLKSQS